MPVQETIPAVSLFGVRIHAVNMDEAMQHILRFVREGIPRQVVTADSSMVVMAQKDEYLREVINQADLVTPDSIGILWACRRQGIVVPERVSGVDIVVRLVQASAQTGLRLYFLGAQPGVAEEAAQRLQMRYPGAQVVGCQHGYFSTEAEPDIVRRIREAQPDVLCVAMGIPKQEKWIDRHRHALKVPVSIGVGGTFDVLSGRVRRAPLWVQRIGMEWLWRVGHNPRKISKVMLLPRFAWMVLTNQHAIEVVHNGR
ncbi:MAG: WecB/TagA/CpsF family glycosyltransferase [Armatimonadota bacterium]|nr:WecB/TagA/CpsF family glycosyltransferase [bacterium]MDW8321851.1 WecB/TagA/CpsF family glycosyltransferase [Armatimonadota bacterium]